MGHPKSLHDPFAFWAKKGVPLGAISRISWLPMVGTVGTEESRAFQSLANESQRPPLVCPGYFSSSARPTLTLALTLKILKGNKKTTPFF